MNMKDTVILLIILLSILGLILGVNYTQDATSIINLNNGSNNNIISSNVTVNHTQSNNLTSSIGVIILQNTINHLII
ncbi:MAG: hypothetical protein E7Z80_02850 [Methanobrevibacter thaueri]|nr:hypothetical protein [Methanobrevibacter thaueri]